VLSDLTNPADLKGLSIAELEALAAEIRSRMIEVVTRNGGHLASSLGAVELTVALHHVFDAPGDQIVFDVGHQAYAHKMLTGRAALFPTLRLEGGLSGFPRRDESPYDAFGTGHSSTSISAAQGLAIGRDLFGRGHRVVAVIGDGALTGGLAMEGLNNVGHLQNDLLVVYNDNRMSISPNVGAMSQYLSLRMTTPEHIQLRERVKTILARLMPQKGGRLIRRFQRAEEALKGFLVSPTAFLAAWGFKYLGPIDGHDLARLVGALKQVRILRRPVLLHVVTTKGKGFAPAETDPLAFHGIGRAKTADPLAPAARPRPRQTYTEVFGAWLAAKAKSDPRIVAITAAMSQGTGLEPFFALHPDRAFDVGIAEGHAVAMAAGMAAAGLRPVVAVYSTFLQRAFDQLFHDVALQNLPVVFAVDRAGLVGEDGPTHHGGLDLGYLRMLPNFTVMAPKDERELALMLDKALSLPGPAAVRYPRGTVSGRASASCPPIEMGKAEILRRGPDIALAAIGQTVWPAMDAAAALSAKGVEATVINMRFVKPLDAAAVAEAARSCGRILTAEENSLSGGLFGAVAEAAAGLGLPVVVRGAGLGDEPVLHATPQSQRALLGLDAAGLERAALAFFPDPIRARA
jgi:1-deoxy-D-xylulose-5-phosphate synthase